MRHEMASASGALVDSLGFVLLVWSIPAAILVVGTPIVMAAALVIALMRWILQA